MPITPDQFRDELRGIRADLARQGDSVTDMASRVFDAVYERDVVAAEEIVTRDDEIDKADIEIERHAVDLLVRASRDSCGLDPAPIRSVLTAVKVNNELERIADAASVVAEKVISLGDRTTPFPKTLLVMTNSVIGIVRDVVKAFAESNPKLAESVLASEGTVLKFNDLIVRDAEERVADGRMNVDVAFELHGIASMAVTMADHCTNIAEQVIYESTGQIVRHTQGQWVQLPEV
ncbi:MAG: phosphate uptake regulator PhoU [Phycisphaerales bacterium]